MDPSRCKCNSALASERMKALGTELTRELMTSDSQRHCEPDLARASKRQCKTCN
jgi:hypothetical protein